jgi:hypothetical protein
MTKDKFQILCEQVLIPRLGELLHRQLAERDGMLEIMSQELIRIRELLERIARGLR